MAVNCPLGSMIYCCQVSTIREPNRKHSSRISRFTPMSPSITRRPPFVCLWQVHVSMWSCLQLSWQHERVENLPLKMGNQTLISYTVICTSGDLCHLTRELLPSSYLFIYLNAVWFRREFAGGVACMLLLAWCHGALLTEIWRNAGIGQLRVGSHFHVFVQKVSGETAWLIPCCHRNNPCYKATACWSCEYENA